MAHNLREKVNLMVLIIRQIYKIISVLLVQHYITSTCYIYEWLCSRICNKQHVCFSFEYLA